MISKHQVPEESKKTLVRFREYLEKHPVEEQFVDCCMADISLYVLDYSAECLGGSSIEDINAFDVHCFLADYMIRRVPNCSPQNICQMLDSIRVFIAFLQAVEVVDFTDRDEILDLCEDSSRYIMRLEEYCELVKARDMAGLMKWRESVLDAFGI